MKWLYLSSYQQELKKKETKTYVQRSCLFKFNVINTTTDNDCEY